MIPEHRTRSLPREENGRYQGRLKHVSALQKNARHRGVFFLKKDPTTEEHLLHYIYVLIFLHRSLGTCALQETDLLFMIAPLQIEEIYFLSKYRYALG